MVFPGIGQVEVATVMADQDMRQKGAANAPTGAPVVDLAERRGRRDPFAHGALPQRPTYLPEEEGAGRSELWHVLKAILVASAAILAVGWLLARH
jgi:hypothetical protein